MNGQHTGYMNEGTAYKHSNFPLVQWAFTSHGAAPCLILGYNRLLFAEQQGDYNCR